MTGKENILLKYKEDKYLFKMRKNIKATHGFCPPTDKTNVNAHFSKVKYKVCIIKKLQD